MMITFPYSAMNSRFSVAVHVLTLLALADGPLPSQAIAGSVNTNPVVIRRLLRLLSHAGLTQGHLGAEGGASLVRPAAEITLLDVYRATAQPGLFGEPAGTPNPLCLCGRNIHAVLAPALAEAKGAMAAALSYHTIADLAAAIREREVPAAAQEPSSPFTPAQITAAITTLTVDGDSS